MTQQDREQIRAFIGNPAMVAAVESVLIPEQDPTAGVDTKLDDAEYGRAVKANVLADEKMRARFAELQRIASSNPQPAPVNEAR